MKYYLLLYRKSDKISDKIILTFTCCYLLRTYRYSKNSENNLCNVYLFLQRLKTYYNYLKIYENFQGNSNIQISLMKYNVHYVLQFILKLNYFK